MQPETKVINWGTLVQIWLLEMAPRVGLAGKNNELTLNYSLRSILSFTNTDVSRLI
jgi:hypothetical protein